MRLLLVVACLFSTILLTDCHLVRGFKYRKLDPKDIKKYPALPVQTGNFETFCYKTPEKRPNEDWVTYLDTALLDSKTFAFLVIRNDSLLYEKYMDDWEEVQLFPSYSVAKSFTSALTGIALQEGKIKNLDEPITNYLPELLKKDARFAQVSIQHVLDMRSGVKFSEKYQNLNADVWKMAFSADLNRFVQYLSVEKPAGQVFEYKSVNSQLLGMVVERAVGKKLSDYLTEKMWRPMGMESSALWNIDDPKKQTVKGFCCLNATARDYARFGSLYLHKGNWHGQQILPQSWVEKCSPDTLAANGFYKNQWWMWRRFPQFPDSLSAEAERVKTKGTILKSENKQYVVVPAKMKAYIAKGILGQYIYVNPETNVVIVRLGKYWKYKGFKTAEAFVYDVGRRV
ncbi:MAG: serine hydrolase [Saprospiraceae bacterium]|nr:serine hydrolase [Saprospiraceae bacterium]